MIESLVSQLTESNDLMKSQLEQLRKECTKLQSDSSLRAHTNDTQQKSEEIFEFERRLRLKDMQLEEQQRDEAMELAEQLQQRLDLDDGNANGGLVDPGSNAIVSQSTSDDETREVESLRQQLLESNNKRDDVIKVAEQMRQRLEEELGKTQNANIELQELRQRNAQLDQLRQQLEQANSKLQDSEKFAADLQSYSDGVDRELENVRQQFTECSKKRDDVIKVAEQMRQRLEEELGKSATAHTELEQLKLEHAKLRNDYSGMERTMTEMLTREHELNTQLTEAQGKLRQAEEAIGWFKQELPRKDGEIANLNDEVRHLKERVNTLLENLAGQEQLNNYQSGNDLLNKHRSMRPPGGGRNV